MKLVFQMRAVSRRRIYLVNLAVKLLLIFVAIGSKLLVLLA